MSGIIQNKPVYKILTQETTFPYSVPVQASGISIVNDGDDTVTVEVAEGSGTVHTINCTTNNRTYSGDFSDIKSINATAGTTFQIEVRGI